MPDLNPLLLHFSVDQINIFACIFLGGGFLGIYFSIEASHVRIRDKIGSLLLLIYSTSSIILGASLIRWVVVERPLLLK